MLKPQREAEVRPQDIRSFEGATSNPPVEFPDAPYAIETMHPEDEHDADPIPVIVVDTVMPDDFTDWAPTQFTLNGESPVMIAGARNNRTRLIITNAGTKPAYVVRSVIGNAFTGAPIPPNAVVEMTTNRDVYATCITGDTTLIGVIQEFVIDDE